MSWLEKILRWFSHLTFLQLIQFIYMSINTNENVWFTRADDTFVDITYGRRDPQKEEMQMSRFRIVDLKILNRSDGVAFFDCIGVRSHIGLIGDRKSQWVGDEEG